MDDFHDVALCADCERAVTFELERAEWRHVHARRQQGDSWESIEADFKAGRVVLLPRGWAVIAQDADGAIVLCGPCQRSEIHTEAYHATLASCATAGR